MTTKQTDSFITIPATLEGLEKAVESILDEGMREVVLESIRTRKKWYQIKQEFRLLRKDIPAKQAIDQLHEKYHYSKKTIEVIIYSR